MKKLSPGTLPCRGNILSVWRKRNGQIQDSGNAPTVNKTIRLPADVVQGIEEAIQGEGLNLLRLCGCRPGGPENPISRQLPPGPSPGPFCLSRVPEEA